MRYTLLLLVLAFIFMYCKQAKTQPNPAVQLIDVQESKEIIKSLSNLIIIDTRTPEEVADGQIENAINIDVKADEKTI